MMETPQNNSITDNNSLTQRDERGRFLAGNTGNGGRPKGSRNKLGEAFITDAYEQWKVSGPKALQQMAENDPSGFCRLIGGLLPKEFELQVSSELFRDARDFAEAFRLARDFVGEQRPLIDISPESEDAE